MAARPEVSESSKKSPEAKKISGKLEKLGRRAGSRPGRRKIPGAPEIGSKIGILSLQKNTVSGFIFQICFQRHQNFFANFIFLIRMTTLNLNGRGFEPAPGPCKYFFGPGAGADRVSFPGKSWEFNKNQ